MTSATINTTGMSPVDAAALPVDKGGLGPRPPARVWLQRLCYGIAGAFLLAGLVTAVVLDVAVLIVFAIPVSLFLIAGLSLGLQQPSQRQRVALGCVAAGLLAALGIGMMPRALGVEMEALRDFGFMVESAAAVLAFICAFLPPYKQGREDKALRVAAVVFCACTLMLSYMSVVFVCTPHGH